LQLRSVDGLEVVLRHVPDDVPSEEPGLEIGRPVVQTRPDPGVDDLVERLREPIEEARLSWEARARHAERDLVRAEEPPQHAQVRAVEAEVARRVIGVRRRDERRPRGVGPRRRIVVAAAAACTPTVAIGVSAPIATIEVSAAAESNRLRVFIDVSLVARGARSCSFARKARPHRETKSIRFSSYLPVAGRPRGFDPRAAMAAPLCPPPARTRT